MRVRLKGINRTERRLSDGTVRTYYYAWKGGPRLEGEPGSPEFIASFERAAKQKAPLARGTLLSVMQVYQASAEFGGLAARTRADYVKQIRKIEARFADFPVSGLKDRRTRGIFMEWRDELARASKRQADYAFTVLARIISWAFDRGLVEGNPLEKARRLYRTTRADNIWTPEDQAAFLAEAGPQLRLAFLLALWTGQRQGDLLRLPWSGFDGELIRLKQSKTGARVTIPIVGELKEALKDAPRRSPIMLTNQDGQPWTQDGFRSSWRKASLRAGIENLTFHDLRGTAVTRLFLAGFTHAQIAGITGHSTRDVANIIDRHYVSRDAINAAMEAMAKLGTGTDLPNIRPNEGPGLKSNKEKV